MKGGDLYHRERGGRTDCVQYFLVHTKFYSERGLYTSNLLSCLWEFMDICRMLQRLRYWNSCSIFWAGVCISYGIWPTRLWTYRIPPTLWCFKSRNCASSFLLLHSASTIVGIYCPSICGLYSDHYSAYIVCLACSCHPYYQPSLVCSSTKDEWDFDVCTRCYTCVCTQDLSL